MYGVSTTNFLHCNEASAEVVMKPQLKDRGYDTVLPVQGYRARHRWVIDRHGAVTA
jgi:hypothetical protein